MRGVRGLGVPGLGVRGAAAALLRAVALRLLGLDPRRGPGWHRARGVEALRDARLHAAVRRVGREAAWMARAAGRIGRGRG